MKNYKLNSIISYAASLIILLGTFSQAEAGEGTSELRGSINLEKVKTFDGQPIVIKNDKLTHLIFQEIWSSYEGQGEEARVAALPKTFIDISQQVWVQPGINVTEAQLSEYQGYFPQMKPLVLDHSYRLMRSLGNWDLPLHVIIKDGKKVFSGSGEQLSAFALANFSTESAMKQWLQVGGEVLSLEPEARAVTPKPVSFSINEASKLHYHKPIKGDKAPTFISKNMEGNPVNLADIYDNNDVSLVFLDSLCPMPHFIGCEVQLEQLNELIESDGSREWLGVVSSFYVNEDVVKQFRDKFKLKLPLIFDMDNQIFQSYGVHASPYQIDIDREGHIRSRGSELH